MSRWGSRRSVTVVVVAALGAVLAGCGAATPAVRPVSSTAPAVPVAASAGGATAAGNRRAATAEAARLLAMAPVPPGAVAAGSVPPEGSALQGPVTGRAGVDSLVDETRFWRVDLPYAQTLAWLKAHPPAGLTAFVSTSDGASFRAPDTAQWSEPSVAIGAAPLSASSSLIRADGMAIWLDPTPYRDDSPGRRVRVSVSGGCPATDANVVGVSAPAATSSTTLLPPGPPSGGLICRFAGLNGHRFTLRGSARLDAASAARVAAATRMVPLAHSVGGWTSWPNDDASADIIALSYPGRPDADLWYSPTGCSTVANGTIVSSALSQRFSDAVAAVKAGQ